MKPSHRIARRILATLLFAGFCGMAHGQQLSLPDRIAALKASLATSQATLRQYSWIETTVVSLNGQEKSNKQMRCYYGADGALQKVEVSESPTPAAKPGLRGRIIANKKAELTDYMMSAVALVKTYVPPEPAKIQAAKDAGKVTIALLPAGNSVRLNFASYEKPGDNLGVEIDTANNRALGLNVSTYLDSPADAVTLNARMAQLNDGTTYPSSITLVAQAKGIQVTVQNSGYQKSK